MDVKEKKERKTQKKLLSEFKSFFNDKNVLIVDSSRWSLEYVANLLNTMGVRNENILAANNFSNAEKQIIKKKPEVIISDYDLNAKCGLDLVHVHRKNIGQSKFSIFILLTENTSQVTVARAAEEEVDAYILKPFSSIALRDAILNAAETKIDPGQYIRMIDKGKKYLNNGSLDEAATIFETAKTMDRAPVLACFYLGQVEMARKDFAKAERHYLEGLHANKIHYKCMMGLYDVLMEQKKYGDAYTVVRRISRYFPANSQRLTTVLKLAVVTQSYDDVERYYLLFTKISQREPELIKYLCVALVICGKHYLKRRVKSRALDLFRRAMMAAEKDTKIHREVILNLFEFNLFREAEKLFALIPPQFNNSPDYIALEYLLLDRESSNSRMIERGEELLEKGYHDPLIYQILIKRLVDDGQAVEAQPLIQVASEKWPAMQFTPIKSKQETSAEDTSVEEAPVEDPSAEETSEEETSMSDSGAALDEKSASKVGT